MAGLVPRIAGCLIVAGMLCLGVASVAHAGAGYQGLFAPSGDDVKKDQPAAEDKPAPSYEGLIAPAPDPRRAPEEPAGYAGVVPGKVKQSAPKSDVARKGPSVKDADDLKRAAAIDAAGKVQAPEPPIIAKNAPSRSDKPRTRVSGLLPAEYAAKQSIDRMMMAVKDPKASQKVRADRVKRTAEKLAEMSGAMRSRLDIPETAYRANGASTTFIKEERDGALGALARIDKAIMELKKYK